ncbi:membrane protein insertase YidC [Nocardiopsis sp. MG754419]|uniref:YidC/Oxa1 family membrane protein insertase n=1 Tax=Nocardiopsis sp. MG754419 TaxID=2259865 RepID=UPI001BA83CB9|nr:membrane protein insertase YidC [Nocardiopsis sp. MG754419]MBR8741669.1 insertase [Nocardiopsis sp. MG754419]
MYTFGPIAAVIDVLATILAVLTDLLTPFTGALAAGLAVIVLTMAVRVLLLPLGVAQTRAEKQRARLAPRLAAITERHRKNPERMVAEQRKVYAEAGTSPLAGCLPGLAQIPLVIALYGVFIGVAPGTEALLERPFAGVALGDTVVGGTFAPVFVVMLVVLAVVAWANRRYVVLPTMRAAPSGPPMIAALSYMQFVTVVVALFVPLAAGLYLCASTAWALGEKLVLRRLIPD